MSTSVIDNAVGTEYPDLPVSWTRKDVLTYALGTGAKCDDFHLVYELNKNFNILPTFPTVLFLKGVDSDVTLFADKVKGRAKTGLPEFDPNRVVHFVQTIEIIKPLPVATGSGWKLKQRITSVSENKSGVIVQSEARLVDGNGTEYAKLYTSAFNLGAKITGKKYAKSIAGPPQSKPIPRDRKPDWVVKDQTTPEQAVLYRLSGDFNPLHVDPAIGEAAGFGGVILHGLATYGFTARALIGAIAGGDTSALTYFGGRFTSPVKPGNALEISAWELGPGPNGTTEVAFETKNLGTGKVVISDGLAYIRKQEKSKL
ncbi:hypothetical protein EWM64_g5125 [Hericium alpestre]|uniref:Uncharacterized protein n=1 Tax=Hericium alpestre TaxID=135208 RepID=A0A4Y9ZWD7_9AGAM|nr:hypothetical protein EWM64_g5125 [Hericium alpestre]